MQTTWTRIVVLLLCSELHLLRQASGERRILQGSAARPARFNRHSSNTIGKAGMHGAIADLVDFFGFEQKPASENPEAPHASKRANNNQVMHCSYPCEHQRTMPCQGICLRLPSPAS